MWSNLPREILERVFSDESLTKKDLLELQRACKRWSPVLQNHIFRVVSFKDSSLYQDCQSPLSIMQSANLLIKTFFLANNQNRLLVHTIDLDSLLLLITHDDILTQDPHVCILLLAHLCPNLGTLSLSYLSKELYKILSNLHRDGYLERLENVPIPCGSYIYKADFLKNYNDAAREFKDTIKGVWLVNPYNRRITSVINPMAAAKLISPDYLQEFVRLETLHLLEFSTMRLNQVEDLLQKCPRQLKSINIEIICDFETVQEGAISTSSTTGGSTTTAIHPRHSVETLVMQLPNTLNSAELIYMMEAFPSLQTLNFSMNEEQEFSPILDETLALGFCDYLLTIAKVDYGDMHLTLDFAFRFFSHLQKSIQVKTVCTASVASQQDEEEAAIVSLQHEVTLPRSNRSQIKTDTCAIHVTLYSSDAQTLFAESLVLFKDAAIEKLVVGPASIDEDSQIQYVSQEAIDYIVDNYLNLVDLEFRFVEFPSQVLDSKTRRISHLNNLKIDHCRTKQDYYNKLSFQIEFVNYFHLESDGDDSSDTRIIINMPYTSFNTIAFNYAYLDIHIVKLWANMTCTILMVSSSGELLPLAMDDYHDLESQPGTYELIIHCRSLQLISTPSGSYEM